MRGRARGVWSDHGALIIVAATVGVLAIVTGSVFLAYRQAASELVVQRDEQLAFLSAARLREELQKYADTLETVARTPGVSSGNRVRQVEALRRSAPSLEVFDGGVVLLDRYGQVRAAHPTRSDLVGEDWSDHQMFRAHLTSAAPAFSSATDDGPDGASVVLVSVPVQDSDGAFMGVLGGLFRLGNSEGSPLYASIVRLRIGQSGTTYVLDGNRRILYASDFRDIGAGAGEAGPVDLPDERTSGAFRTRDREGHEVILAFAPVPGTGWTLVTEDDWATLTRSVYGHTRSLIVLVAAGFVVPVAGLHAFARQQRSAARSRRLAQESRHLTDVIRGRLQPDGVPVLPGWDLALDRRLGAHREFADLFVLDDGRVFAAHATLPASELPPAVLMATLRAALRSGAQAGLPPDRILATANTVICPEVPLGATVACAVCLLDPSQGVVQVAAAGPEGLWVLHGAEATRIGPTGPALGAGPDAVFDLESTALGPGDGLVLVTSRLADGQFGVGARSGRLTVAPQSAGSVRARDLADAFATGDAPAMAATAQDSTVLVLLRRIAGAVDA